MDKIDIKILKLLQENSRISASQIGNIISLSVPAVSDRLKKLDASGVINQYTTIISAQKFNKTLTVIIFIGLENTKYTENFVEMINKEDEILECHHLAGEFDYSLKIVTENTITLEKILNRLKSISGVQKTTTMVTLSTIKHNHSIIPQEI